MLESDRLFLLGEFHAAYDHHALPRATGETELDIGLDLVLADAAGIVHKGLTTAIAWGEGTRDGVF